MFVTGVSTSKGYTLEATRRLTAGSVLRFLHRRPPLAHGNPIGTTASEFEARIAVLPYPASSEHVRRSRLSQRRGRQKIRHRSGGENRLKHGRPLDPEGSEMLS